jgi:uncharacterized protein (TIGR02118 family)
VVLWRLPEGADEEEWERWYREQHVPLVLKMPGMTRYIVSRTVSTAHGDGYYRMAEQWFPSREALEAAVASPEGQAVAADAGPRVRDLVLMVAEEEEVSHD